MQPTKKKKAWNIKCQNFWIFLPLERLWRTFNVYVSVRFLQKENYLVFFACLYNNVMLLITVIHTENRISWYYFHDTELRCMLFWEIIIRMIVSLLQMILIMLITCICKVKLNDPPTLTLLAFIGIIKESFLIIIICIKEMMALQSLLNEFIWIQILKLKDMSAV